MFHCQPVQSSALDVWEAAMVTGVSGHSLHGSACLIYFVCFLPLIAVRPKWHYNMQKRPCWRWLCTVCSKQEHAVQWPVLGRTLQCTFALCLTFWASSLTKWILVPRPAARYTQHITSITTISDELNMMCRYFPVWARRAHQYSTPLSVSLSG